MSIDKSVGRRLLNSVEEKYEMKKYIKKARKIYNDFRRANSLLHLSPSNIIKLYSIASMAVKGNDVASEKMPIRLQIEITDKCNFKCIMCDRNNLQRIRGSLKNDISY